MMSNQTDKLMEKAIELADRPYLIKEYEDTLSNGQKIVFLKNPELRGCMAQGATLEEAKKELRDARIAYIHSLLIDGQKVPEPMGELKDKVIIVDDTATTGSYGSSGIEWGSFEQILEKVIQPEHRKHVSTHRVG